MPRLATRCLAFALTSCCLAPLVARGDAFDLLTGAPPPAEQPVYANVVTGPAGTQPVDQPETGAQRTLTEFIGHFSGYDPTYFIAGPADPVVKFQFSFKYRLFNPDAPLGKLPVLGSLHFAYTQLSLWALDQPSAPFFDTNYQPEFFYSNEDVTAVRLPFVSQLGLQGGFGHDSNGQGGSTSRQLNLLFIRPIFNFGDPEQFHAYVAPKAYVYIGNLDQNPDISRFRGYCDLRAVVGWRQGLELSFLGRLGSDYNKGSYQLDLTYPLRDLLDKNLDVYFDAQWFNGFGESLLEYNRNSNSFRIGLALVR